MARPTATDGCSDVGWLAGAAAGPVTAATDFAAVLDEVSAALCGGPAVAQAVNAMPAASALTAMAAQRVSRMGPDAIAVHNDHAVIFVRFLWDQHGPALVSRSSCHSSSGEGNRRSSGRTEAMA